MWLFLLHLLQNNSLDEPKWWWFPLLHNRRFLAYCLNGDGWWCCFYIYCHYLLLLSRRLFWVFFYNLHQTCTLGFQNLEGKYLQPWFFRRSLGSRTKGYLFRKSWVVGLEEMTIPWIYDTSRQMYRLTILCFGVINIGTIERSLNMVV